MPLSILAANGHPRAPAGICGPGTALALMKAYSPRRGTDMLKTFAFALLAVLPAGVFAQTVTKQNEVTATVTITAIDRPRGR